VAVLFITPTFVTTPTNAMAPIVTRVERKGSLPVIAEKIVVHYREKNENVVARSLDRQRGELRE
jgi:hypothetical protein